MFMYLSLAVALLGLLLYILAANPKVVELGRILFGCGILAFLWSNGQAITGLLR